MSEASEQSRVENSKALVWAGRVISFLVIAMFMMSAVMKLQGGEELEKGMAHSGIPASLLMPLAVLEITCVVFYLIPQTAVIGAILLTGYLGGAIFTHVRIGEPFFVQGVLGVFVWLGIYFRESRLRELIPFRQASM